MISCFNGKFLESVSIDPTLNRGFMYGDGLFESIRIESKSILNYDRHFERLEKGMFCLELEKNKEFKEKLKNEILATCDSNNLEESRVKVIVWRNAGGFFTPSQKSFSYLITCATLIIQNDPIKEIGIADTIRIPITSLSNLKTLNNLYYILAGIEKKNRKLDEIILLNTAGYVCECSSSNLFWKKNEVVYTPSLESGCIAGTKRALEIETLRNQNIVVIEGFFTTEDLKEAEKIWATNTFGTRLVKNLLLDY